MKFWRAESKGLKRRQVSADCCSNTQRYQSANNPPCGIQTQPPFARSKGGASNFHQDFLYIQSWRNPENAGPRASYERLYTTLSRRISFLLRAPWRCIPRSAEGAPLILDALPSWPVHDHCLCPETGLSAGRLPCRRVRGRCAGSRVFTPRSARRALGIKEMCQIQVLTSTAEINRSVHGRVPYPVSDCVILPESKGF